MKISDPQFSLKALRADVAAFRGKCRPRARIPAHIREAILAAVDAGVKPTVLKTELGVTSGQVAVWRRRRPSQVTAAPRVLDVVPSVLGTAMPSGLRVSYEGGRLLLELSF